MIVEVYDRHNEVSIVYHNVKSVEENERGFLLVKSGGFRKQFRGSGYSYEIICKSEVR